MSVANRTVTKEMSLLLEQKNLNRQQARSLLASLLEGASDEEMLLFLTTLNQKGQTVEELAGFVDCLSEKAIAVDAAELSSASSTQTGSTRTQFANKQFIDVCGTGGDLSGTFNVSTTLSFVLACSGLVVAKHGNRSVSSRSGSFDLIESLGIGFDSNPKKALDSLKKFNLAFLFAPSFHPALARVRELRKKLGVPTVFNLLGPLINPVVQVKRQMVGVNRPDLVLKVAQVLKLRGSTEAIVVHGKNGLENGLENGLKNGLDELSLSGPTSVAHLKNGSIEQYEVNPGDFGLEPAPLEALKGAGPEENAKILLGIFRGKKGPQRDMILLNAGAALVVGAQAKDFREGVAQAAEAIDSGAALNLLEEMKSADKAKGE